MDEKCPVCGHTLEYCVLGEYCSNEYCGYVDGHDFGPRTPKPTREDRVMDLVTAANNVVYDYVHGGIFKPGEASYYLITEEKLEALKKAAEMLPL